MTKTAIAKLPLLMIVLCISLPAHSKLTVHDVKRPEKLTSQQMEIDAQKPENIKTYGRGNEQQLESVLSQITENKMHIKYIDPETKDVKVNWRSNGEPLQIILSRLGRQYGVDIVINETAETLYISFSNGQCTPNREKYLDERSKLWKKMNITDAPTLPNLLKVQTDLAGYNYRLC